jgi:hypothetical protein
MLTRNRILPMLFAAAVLMTSTACAAQMYGRSPRGYPAQGVRVDDRAYRYGYDAGIQSGRDDARRGRGFNMQRHGEFRSADRGYDGYGRRNDYREIYRRGFSAGYNDGFRQFDRRGGYGGYDDRGRPSGPYYGDRGTAVFRSPATDTGCRDGYEAGRDDARGGDRFDPVRAKRYREGDHDYDSRYGSRDEYKRAYRDAFQRGYEQGYREVRR